MRLVNIFEMSPDDYIAQNIFSATGSLLVKSGTPISVRVINTLNNNKIFSVYVTDEMTEKIKEELGLDEAFDLEDIIDPNLRRTFNQNMKDQFERFKKSRGIGRYSADGNDFIDHITDMAQSIVGELTVKKDPVVSLTDIKHLDIYDYEHSVNTAILSVLTGINMGFSEADLTVLAQGALLMNVGNEFIVDKIKQKEDAVDADEWLVLKRHTLLGRELLSDRTSINAYVKNVVLNHHERMNGSGYPRGLEGEDIDKYSRIVMIADVYDAMTSDRSHRKAHTPNEALEYLMGATNLFDHKSLVAFTRNIVPYPVGEFVALDNGDIGLVIGNNKHLPLRPIIRVTEGLHINQLVDLSVNTNMVITRRVKRPW
ncbi:HD-GYP domain-containing protein [Fusibacter sp. JL298sf-3]